MGDEPTSDAALRVAARFGWSDALVERLRRGHINDTFAVTSGSDRYVLQRINRAVFPDVAGMTANIEQVCRHLGQRGGGDLLPQPVPAPGGGWLIDDGTDVWRAFVRVHDAAPASCVTPQVVGSAGALLGRLHTLLGDLSSSTLAVTLPGFHDLRRRRRQLLEAARADPLRRAGRAREELDQALATAALVDLSDDLTARTPLRVAHYDPKLDNYLFRRGEAVCLVDLDTLMPGRWYWDLGDLLRSASSTSAEDEPDASSVRFDRSLYDAALAGYRRAVTGGPLEAAELEAAGSAGAIATCEQAMRFLTDWLTGDRYFRTARPDHNLQRARTQLALLAGMPWATP